ncbi:MAG: hypothetical protein GY710_02015 [Desulfobacteraceae bacterium]|nr:hypothetical protein [Desulfobacteraceae bacterium]
MNKLKEGLAEYQNKVETGEIKISKSDAPYQKWEQMKAWIDNYLKQNKEEM